MRRIVIYDHLCRSVPYFIFSLKFKCIDFFIIFQYSLVVYGEIQGGHTQQPHTHAPAEDHSSRKREGCAPTVRQGDHSRPREPRRCYRVSQQSRCVATRVLVPTARTPPLILSNSRQTWSTPARHRSTRPSTQPSRTTSTSASEYPRQS